MTTAAVLDLPVLTDGQLLAIGFMVLGVVLLAIALWGYAFGHGADE